MAKGKAPPLEAKPEEKSISFLHRFTAGSTRFIDQNIRLVQGGVYLIGGLALLRVLHSVRVWSQFRSVFDIPPSFFTSAVNLRGRVIDVRTSVLRPAVQLSESAPNAGAGLHNTSLKPAAATLSTSNNIEKIDHSEDETHVKSNPDDSVCQSEPVNEEHRKENNVQNTTVNFQNVKSGNEMIESGSSPVRDGSNNSSIGEKEAELLTPVYIEVQHIPIMRIPFLTTKVSDETGLLLKLAAVECPVEVSQSLKARLEGNVVKLQLLGHLPMMTEGSFEEGKQQQAKKKVEEEEEEEHTNKKLKEVEEEEIVETGGGEEQNTKTFGRNEQLKVNVIVARIWTKRRVFGWRLTSLNQELVAKGLAAVDTNHGYVPPPYDVPPPWWPVRSTVSRWFHGRQTALVVGGDGGPQPRKVSTSERSFNRLYERLKQTESKVAATRVGIWAERADLLGILDTRGALRRVWDRYRKIRSQDSR